jgi:hypothetical protein
MGHEMADHEVVKAQMKWIAEKVDKMDTKLDNLIQSHAFFKGKMVGISVVISTVIMVCVELIRR